MSNYLNTETIGLHGGSFRKDDVQTSVAIQTHQTNLFQFNSTDNVANIGDARSLAIHSASTTHSQLKENEK